MLTCHPDTPCEAIREIAVDVAWRPEGGLAFRYSTRGDLARLFLPDRMPTGRADGLWRTTCFEAFVGDPGMGDGYTEMNFSPSGQWATYTFGGYRSHMSPSDVLVTGIEGSSTSDSYVLVASIANLGLYDAEFLHLQRLGLSAVIEEVGGRKSYWALAHAPGRPDFHAPAGFAVPFSDLEPA